MDWSDEETPAYGSYEYSPDSVDATGTEALERFNDKVEWNIPFNENQVGKEEISLPYGTPRFRDDDIDSDILAGYDWVPFGLGDQINAHKSVLTLEKGIAFQPKLLIWDRQDSNFARIQRYNIPGFEINQNNNYNFPYTFNEWDGNTGSLITPNTAYPANYPLTGLYPRFYSINNPKTSLAGVRGQTFSFSFRIDCQILLGWMDAENITLPMGNGRITRLSIDLGTNIISVSGEV